jgi:Sulfotransferase family
MVEENQEAANPRLRSSQPVFLIGFFRSGTSLLHAILNQHSQVALMYECNVWDFPEFLSQKRFRHNWLERLEFLNQALSRHRLIFGGSQRGLENVQTPEELYRTFAERKSPAFWGEKSPAYCTRLRKLARHYPGCSFILIWRDPLEIYRSVVRASGEARFFRRPGTLSRFIFSQEQMIRQAINISRAGGRVYCVSYDDLIDKTKEACRGICEFLGIEFDEKMLDLTNADFSAVFPVSARHHQHLRRGVIKRQQFSEEILPAPVAGKLRRFRSRWNRLRGEWNGVQDNKNGEPEPSRSERFYYHATGLFFHTMDDGRRTLIEFLPLPWLRGYRLVKEGFLLRRAEARLSLREQLSAHSITILMSYAILTCVVALDYSTGPDVTLAPFYLVPSAILTLIIGRRWGIFAAVVAVVCWSGIQSVELKGSLELGIVVWNSIMRFLVFLTVVLLLDRVRVEAAATRKADI